MQVVERPLFTFDNTFARDLTDLYLPWQPAPVPAPELLVLNDDLAVELGADPAALRTPDGLAVLAGNAVAEGSTPLAQAYSGHQFGGFSPRLGDGRALLIGEVIDVDGRRRDLHLKGSGRTPFSRGGDGKAVVGPMLREYIVGEAMHALGIPTTRALAVVATGESIAREQMLPGAILTRVAASHLRVGTFQYAATQGDVELIRRLADYAVARHYPDAAGAPNPYVALLRSVLEAQASLVARWMAVGFIHGVMNTDNMTISGETIDYGPCAFMDEFDPATVFSSIDTGGRYAYGNQPQIALWNLTRLAEALLPLIADDTEAAVAQATAELERFAGRFDEHWTAAMRAKLGIANPADDDRQLLDDLATQMQAQRADYTTVFRALATAREGDTGPVRALFGGSLLFDAWLARWQARATASAAEMRGVNPVYIARNHIVEAALAAATAGDMQPVHRLIEVVSDPFTERAGLEQYAVPAPGGSSGYRTFCGT
jgi:uncharacterized protein YdiU (UPF0061 family)